MAQAAPYLPRRDTDLDSWLANFSGLLTASPATYGQTSGTATAVAAAVASWSAAYALVTSPSTKTAATVAAKDTERVNVLATVRPVAQNISLNPAVLSTDKVAIGVNPRQNSPQPITPPTTLPLLTIQGGASLQLYARYRDSAATPSVKSKPYGVKFVVLHYITSATPIIDPTLLTNKLNMTKSPTLVQFQPGDGGKQCYLCGQYLLGNGRLGGFGPIVSFTVPIGA
jgi:hypothetical protein